MDAARKLLDRRVRGASRRGRKRALRLSAIGRRSSSLLASFFPSATRTFSDHGFSGGAAVCSARVHVQHFELRRQQS
eukprot:scaffold3290_cov259-Pinguiococcus_pyrenoidosus.AAC.16